MHLGIMAHSYNLSTGRDEVGGTGIQGFLSYIASLKLAWTTRAPVSQYKHHYTHKIMHLSTFIRKLFFTEMVVTTETHNWSI